jgi:hypothetical protein
VDAQAGQAVGDLLQGHGGPAIEDHESDEIRNGKRLRVDVLQDVGRDWSVDVSHVFGSRGSYREHNITK